MNRILTRCNYPAFISAVSGDQAIMFQLDRNIISVFCSQYMLGWNCNGFKLP